MRKSRRDEHGFVPDGEQAAPCPGPVCAPTLPSTPGHSCNPHPNGDRTRCLGSCSAHPPCPSTGQPCMKPRSVTLKKHSTSSNHRVYLWAHLHLQTKAFSVRPAGPGSGAWRTPHSHPTPSNAPSAAEPGPSPLQSVAPHINTDVQITKIALEYSQMNKNYSDMYSRARALCTQPSPPGQPGGPGGLPGMRSCS